MKVQPASKLMLILLAITLPGGVLLLLFPKQVESLVDDVKIRLQRYRTIREP
jgi:hypothetical protein